MAKPEPWATKDDAAVMPMTDARVDARQSGNTDAPATETDAPMQGGCTQAFTGALATWSFAAEPGNQVMTAASATAPGVVAGAIERAGTLTAVSGANAINSSGWPLTTQPDPLKHYRLTIAPPTGCGLQITALSIDAKSSTTGPTMAVVQTSIDSFVQQTALSTATVSTPAMSLPAQTQMIELHVSGFSASSSAGTMRLQGTFTITGSLQ